MCDLYLPRYRELVGEVGVQATVKARYKIQVCRNGVVIREPFGDNFIPNNITNTGLDQLMLTADAYNFGTACRAGSGTNPPTNTDTALQTLLKTTTTLLGSGNGTTFDTVNGAATHTKVWEFSAEVGTVTYNEIGMNGGSGGTAVCTRALFPSSVTCLNGDNLRVTYNWTISLPSTITAIPVSLSAVNGFNISGSMKVVGTFINIFGQLNASGSAAGGVTWPAIIYGNSANGYLGSGPTAFPLVNTSLASFVNLNSASAVTAIQAAYTNGSFTRGMTYQWPTSNPATTVSNVNNLFFNWNGSGNFQTGTFLLLTATQTKANTNVLTVTYTGTVARA